MHKYERNDFPRSSDLFVKKLCINTCTSTSSTRFYEHACFKKQLSAPVVLVQVQVVTSTLSREYLLVLVLVRVLQQVLPVVYSTRERIESVVQVQYEYSTPYMYWYLYKYNYSTVRSAATKCICT